MRAERLLAVIIVLGIASRVVHTGWIVFDKYLGDALYAAMAYTLIGLFTRIGPLPKAVIAMSIMTVIELFQLTMVPAHMALSSHIAVRIAARLLGTEFSLLDLLAYGVGILGVFFADTGAGWGYRRSD
jgi:Protein of unknown function (DUF2809)